MTSPTKTIRPKSFSATAFQVAETCMARYKAENVDRTERAANAAADLGTAVHAALEMYVLAVYIDKTKPADLNALLFIYRMEFCAVFGTVDPDANEMYADGVAMLKSWFARTDFSGRTVLSVETKTSFPIKTSVGDIPFNYIFDRLDQIDEHTYEVVDYKTIRKALSPLDLRKKIQARCYGLAVQIQYPKAEKIWVRFDLLRHDSVATVFTRKDNIATWNFIKNLAEKILATPDTDLPENLNAECQYCVRKASCKALLSNVAGGGLWALDTTAKRVDARAKLAFQLKGLGSLISDLDEVLLKEAAEEDVLELPSDDYIAKVSQGFQRTVDPERVQHVVGEDLFGRYGGIKLTMADFNKMLKDKTLSPEKKAELQQLVYRKPGELKINIESKNPIDDE